MFTHRLIAIAIVATFSSVLRVSFVPAVDQLLMPQELDPTALAKVAQSAIAHSCFSQEATLELQSLRHNQRRG